MRKVAVVGAGISKFGRRDDASLRELAYEAVAKALKDSGLKLIDLEASFISVANQHLSGYTQPGAVINTYLGMAPNPSFTTTAACASGSAAIRAAWTSIASGLHDLVLVVGAEKMNEVNTSRAVEMMGLAGDPFWEFRPTGITDAGLYSMFANAHMHEYGTSEEQLAMVAVKNHKYASMNPIAHMQKEITLEKALSSPVIAYPLKLYDCSLISDGAAAIIMASEEKGSKIINDSVYLVGLGCATDTASMYERESIVGLKATVEAARQAYKMAGVDPKDIDVAEVHDCFTIAEIMAYEDLGFCEKGEGGSFIEEKRSYIGGDTPVNVSGGLKAKGHPLGASGIAMAAEITSQLRGKVEPSRQVPEANIGLTHNVARTGTHIFVHVFKRE